VRYVLSAVWLSLVLVAAAGVGQDKSAEEQTGPPPLSHASQVDRSRFYCYDCHANYEEEALAQRHEAVGINCMKCHGASLAHARDEANLIAPDIMYPKEKINPACGRCHTSEKFQEVHKALFASGETKGQVCTDCHGDHRLPVRTRRWDKTTGKLLEDDQAELDKGSGSHNK